MWENNRPVGWRNPYNMEKGMVDGKELYRISSGHYLTHNTREAQIYEEGADAMLKVLEEGGNLCGIIGKIQQTI